MAKKHVEKHDKPVHPHAPIEKKKPGRPPKKHDKPAPVEQDLPVDSAEPSKTESVAVNPLHKDEPEPAPEEPATTDEDEDIPEEEAAQMVERHVQKKEEVKVKLEESVDSQDWTQSDPVIPDDLSGRVWIAVYKCPSGHKTKATNRQEKSGVRCYICKGTGKEVKASIMPQFIAKPEPPDDDLEKRRKARKGSE